jgi:nucleotide-binding universal stress UspA family protein
MKSMKESLKIEKTVFATDLLENSRLALDYAMAFAEHFGASMLMLHVVQLSGAARIAELEIHRASVSRLAAEQRLGVLASGVRRLGLNVETEVVDGLTGEAMVFMLELTNHTDALIVPLLIAVAGATLMARNQEVHSIYSIRG